jgi:hypothetical protein
LFGFVEFQGLIAISFSLCPLIAHFVTFEANVRFRLPPRLPIGGSQQLPGQKQFKIQNAEFKKSS